MRRVGTGCHAMVGLRLYARRIGSSGTLLATLSRVGTWTEWEAGFYSKLLETRFCAKDYRLTVWEGLSSVERWHVYDLLAVQRQPHVVTADRRMMMPTPAQALVVCPRGHCGEGADGRLHARQDGNIGDLAGEAGDRSNGFGLAGREVDGV